MYNFDTYCGEIQFHPTDLGDRVIPFIERAMLNMVRDLQDQGYNVSKIMQAKADNEEVFDAEGFSVLCARVNIDTFTDKVVFVCEVAKDWYQKERFNNARA